MQFFAKHISIEDDGECTVLAFADDAESPTAFAILQITNVPDEQDLSLRLDRVHLHLCNDRWYGYDLIESMALDADSLVLRPRASAVQRLGLPEQVRIEIQPSDDQRDELTTELARFAARH
jgi:hypothetical protein